MMRFAFRPTSDLSLNALWLALVNYVVAHQRHEGFVLRIENIGIPESTLAAESRQILEKCALIPDQVLYQSESLHRYQQLAVSLLERGDAFACTCPADARQCSGACTHRTPEEWGRIRDAKQPYVVRIKAPEHAVTFEDRFRGTFTTEPEALPAFVILRSDGTPSQTFATAVDDMLGAITSVIRCDSYLDQTAGQVHIRHRLGFTEAVDYAHLPPILPGDDHNQLPTVPALLKEGFLPDAILNYLLLPDADTPPSLFTLPEALETFRLEELSRSPIRFDRQKLRWLNREHLRRMDEKALSGLYRFADADIGKLIKCYLDEAATLSELDERIWPIFAPKACEGEMGEKMHTLAKHIADAPYLEHYDDLLSHLLAQTGWKSAELSGPLYRLITGADEGPALSRLYPHIQSYITEVARCQP